VKHGKGCSTAKYCIYLVTSFITVAGKFIIQNKEEEFPRNTPENIKEQFSYMRKHKFPTEMAVNIC
jgi:hypothetical protein